MNNLYLWHNGIFISFKWFDRAFWAAMHREARRSSAAYRREAAR